jgi:hypothetical protein
MKSQEMEVLHKKWRMNERISGRMNERINGRMNERINGRMKERISTRMNDRKNARMNERINGRPNEARSWTEETRMSGRDPRSNHGPRHNLADAIAPCFGQTCESSFEMCRS